jgi:hypothetical protein
MLHRGYCYGHWLTAQTNNLKQNNFVFMIGFEPGSLEPCFMDGIAPESFELDP